jgi:hypothetical protein
MVLMTKVVNRLTFMDCGSLLPLLVQAAGCRTIGSKCEITQSNDPQQDGDRKAAAGCRSPKEEISLCPTAAR